MALIEIDEAELAAKNRVVKWTNDVLANPKTRKRALQLAQDIDPNFTAPELEQDAQIDARLNAIEKLIRDDQEARSAADSAARTEREKNQLEQRWLTGRASLREAGYTDEGVGKIEEFMQEHGIVDHGIALPAFERLNPRPVPPATRDNRWGFFDAKTTESPDLKPLFEARDEDFLRTQIASTLAEVRGQR